MLYFEDNFPGWSSGLNFKKSVSVNGITTNGNNVIDFSSSTGGIKFPSGGVTNAPNFSTPNTKINAPILNSTPVAVNATATLTAAQVITGYITSTSAAATTLTLPTGTLLGAALGAVQGTIFDLTIDNTAGANTVTVAVAVNGILSAAAAAGAGAGAGLLTIPSGVTGQGTFQLMFSSATAYTFSRVA